MKKYIPLLVLLFSISFGLRAQTLSNDNFVYSSAPKKAVQAANFNTLTKDEMSQSVTYFDGLGRPIQTTAINQGVNGADLVTPIVYDGFGRQVLEYLPYSISNSTTTYPRIAMSSSTASLTGLYNTPKYENTSNPFSEKSLEASPLNRVLKQASPGTAWAMNSGHEIKFDYQTNKDGEVRLFKVGSSGLTSTGVYDISLLDSGTYPANELYKTVTYDENTTPGNKVGTEEFKNKEGQVVLKRTYESQVEHNTYYVYDNYGNLTYVLPPKAEGTISVAILDDLCYQYKYDYRNRMAEKKLPGKQWEFIVYDRLDRPVATGPAFSPFKDDASVGWMITKYDAFGRIIYTGWSSQAVSSTTRNTLQTAQNGAALYETKDTSRTIDGIAAYYTNANTPTSFKLLTVNYYDNYAFPGAQTPPSTVEGQAVLANIKGLVSGSWTRALSTPSSIAGETMTTFYDAKSRPVRTYQQNHLGGSTSIDSKLDFGGKTIYTITKHKRTSGDPDLITREDFTYSAQDRLLSHTHQIGGVVQLLASNTYDELGKLIIKNVGNTAGSPLQKIDYAYNIRGWLTEINKTANLQQGTDAKDLFGFKISYNTPLAGISDVKGLYNGNISETLWKTGADNTDRGYGYKYDNLNRLKNAIYEKSGLTTDAYNENLSYDKNGNIIFLTRKGDTDPQINPIEIDNLVYTYTTNTNQLIKVADNSNNTSGFNDVNKTGDDYTYDANGNMITDKNKNITAITYNQLNLPKKITFGTTGSIEYIYNAAGVKLEKIVTEGAVVTYTNYLGGYQYKNNILEFFPTAEGYVKNTAGTLSYVFQYKDHLGNIRLSYAKNPATQVLEIIEENNYYPFGLKHKGYNDYVANTNKYKYNGKEFQDELGLGMYDYGWRNYMPDLGRWSQYDPLLNDLKFAHNFDDVDTDDDDEVYMSIINNAEVGGGIFNTDNLNPYGYGYNNPVSFDDPDGRCPTCIVGAIVGAAVDYGTQVAANYLDPSVKNKWTDNISLSSIALSAAEGALTQGGSALRKGVIKGGVMVAKNLVEVNSTTGTSVELNPGKVIKNTLIDAAAGAAAKKVGNLVKTAKLDKIAAKVSMSTNKASALVQKVSGLSSRAAREVAKKTDLKGVSKQLANGVKNITNKSVENTTNGLVKNTVDGIKKNTN